MRVPKTWNDKDILEDEPFLSAFAKGKKHIGSKESYALAKKLQSSGEENVVSIWHKKCLALSKLRQNNSKIKKYGDSSCEIELRTFQAFVEFYWHLSNGDEAAAITQVKRLVTAQGYDFAGPALTDNGTTPASLTNPINITHSDPLNMGKSSLPIQPDRVSIKKKPKTVDTPIQRDGPSHFRPKGHKSGRHRSNLIPAVSGSSMLDRSNTKSTYAGYQKDHKSLTVKKNGDGYANVHGRRSAKQDLPNCESDFTPVADKIMPGMPTKPLQGSQDCHSVNIENTQRQILKGLRFKKNPPVPEPAIENSNSGQCTSSASPIIQQPSLDNMDITRDVPSTASNSQDSLSSNVTLVDATESRSKMESTQSKSHLQGGIIERDATNALPCMKRQRPLSRDCSKRRRLDSDLLSGPVNDIGKCEEAMQRSIHNRGSIQQEEPLTCSQQALGNQSVPDDTISANHSSNSVEKTSLDSSSVVTKSSQQAVKDPYNCNDQGVSVSTGRKRKATLDQSMGVKEIFKVVTKRPRTKVASVQRRASNRLKTTLQIKEETTDLLLQKDTDVADSALILPNENGARGRAEEINSIPPGIRTSNSEETVVCSTIDIDMRGPVIDKSSSHQTESGADQEALLDSLIPLKQEQIELDDMNNPRKSEETEVYIEAPFDKLPEIEQHCYFPKPALPELPPIWAESRQEICESFYWFRSYQGGVYHAHNAVKGYLLGGFPSGRDRFEHGGRLIISHGGGKAESLHTKQGKTTCHAASDQLAQDKSVRALYDNYVHNRPLVLLADDKYALFPYDLKSKKVTYAVLGLYTIVYAWAEYQPANNERGRVVRYKFAFRWCDHQGTPWWNFEDKAPSVENHALKHTKGDCAEARDLSPAKTDEVIVSHLSESPPDASNSYPEYFLRERIELSLTCDSCSTRFVRVFMDSWVCLNPKCRSFWRRADGQFLPIQLDYHPNFLELPLSKPDTKGFETIIPDSPLSFVCGDNITNYAFTRGFHCTSCGRLSCRFKWETWECMHCGHLITIECPPRDAKDFLHQPIHASFKDYSLNSISDIMVLPQTTFAHDAGRGFIQTFILPYNNAKIHHIQQGNSRGRKEADQIFLDYQVQASEGTLKFRRWPMRAHKCRGSLLTNYFSQNSGVPYKYVGGDLNTVPFESAPDAVVKARSLMEKRLYEAIGVKAEFNEVLSAAYMERQKMAFHSDNEVGLGPLVAGLSLGSPALMHFRLHPKFDPEGNKKGTLLSVVLRHGDILVMDGSAVQEYYEHTVVPTNFRIAATARQINAKLHA